MISEYAREKYAEEKCKEKKTSNNFFDIDAFFDDAKKEIGIEGEVELLPNPLKEDKESRTDFSENIPQIILGLKGYDIGNLSEHLKQKLSNTIYHELIHVRDREQAQKDVKCRLQDNTTRSIGKFGFMVFDEYVAYYEANKRYPESEEDIRCSIELVQYAFYSHMLKGFLTLEGRNPRSEKDEEAFFDAFYDNCSAVICNFVIKGKFGDDSDSFSNLVKAVEWLSHSYSRRVDLSWKDYEEIGREFVDIIMRNLSNKEKKIFLQNTGIEKYANKKYTYLCKRKRGYFYLL